MLTVQAQEARKSQFEVPAWKQLTGKCQTGCVRVISFHVCEQRANFASKNVFTPSDAPGVNSHRDGGGQGRNPGNCRRFSTLRLSWCLKCVNSDTDRGGRGHDPCNCRSFQTLGARGAGQGSGRGGRTIVVGLSAQESAYYGSCIASLADGKGAALLRITGW